MYVCKNYLNEVGYASTINTGLNLKHHTCIHTCIHTSNMHTYSYQWSDRVDGQIHTNRFLANMSGEYFFIAYAVVSDENHSLLHTLAVKHRQARGRLLENCRRQYWIAFRCLVEREVLPWIVLNRGCGLRGEDVVQRNAPIRQTNFIHWVQKHLSIHQNDVRICTYRTGRSSPREPGAAESTRESYKQKQGGKITK